MTKFVVPSKEFFLRLIQVLIVEVNDGFTQVGCCGCNCRLSEAGGRWKVVPWINVYIDGVALFGDGPRVGSDGDGAVRVSLGEGRCAE